MMRPSSFRYTSFLMVISFTFIMNVDVPSSHLAIVPTTFGSELRSGDLIFRQGEGIVSEAVLQNRKQSTYSHVGMIVLHNNSVMVLHASPSENPSDFDGVKLETLAKFSQPDRASHIAFMRPFQQEADGYQAAKNAMKYLGKPFDAEFDLKSDDQIYCTELIAKAYQPLNINLFTKLRKARLPFMKGQFLMPQDMYEQKSLVKIAAF